MAYLREVARAKINLSLDVHAKRPDGYHELESLIVFADYGDELVLTPGPDLGLKLDGPQAQGLSSQGDNLVLRAAKAFHALYPKAELGAFTLTKNLPVASGIGGGSADAAAALRCLVRANPSLSIVEQDLLRLALELGADVPVCVRSCTTYVSGIGEEFHEVGVDKKIPAVLVNPNEEVSTAKIFKTLGRPTGDSVSPSPPHFHAAEDFLSYVRLAKNDLELPATQVLPRISIVKRELGRQDGCWTARMSGSGATCFGLFHSVEQSELAADEISNAQPEWWVRAVMLG